MTDLDGPEPQRSDDPDGGFVVAVPTDALVALAADLGEFAGQGDDELTARIPASWLDDGNLSRDAVAASVRESTRDALGRVLAALARRDDVPTTPERPAGAEGP